jgi:hypothetical protein
LPTFRQLPWPCDPGAMNGSLLCPVALVFPTRQQADLAAHLAHRELIIGVPSDPSRCAASPLIWEGRRTRSGAAWWVSQERGESRLGAARYSQLSLLGSKSFTWIGTSRHRDVRRAEDRGSMPRSCLKVRA